MTTVGSALDLAHRELCREVVTGFARERWPQQYHPSHKLECSGTRAVPIQRGIWFSSSLRLHGPVAVSSSEVRQKGHRVVWTEALATGQLCQLLPVLCYDHHVVGSPSLVEKPWGDGGKLAEGHEVPVTQVKGRLGHSARCSVDVTIRMQQHEGA